MVYELNHDGERAEFFCAYVYLVDTTGACERIRYTHIQVLVVLFHFCAYVGHQLECVNTVVRAGYCCRGHNPCDPPLIWLRRLGRAFALLFAIALAYACVHGTFRAFLRHEIVRDERQHYRRGFGEPDCDTVVRGYTVYVNIAKTMRIQSLR